MHAERVSVVGSGAIGLLSTYVWTPGGWIRLAPGKTAKSNRADETNSL